MATSPKTRQAQAQNRGPLAENAKNGTPVAFDLDAYQAEARHEPFVFTLGGDTFTLPHADDLDWHVSVSSDGHMEHPTIYGLLRAAFGDQWATFTGHNLSGAGYGELQRRYLKHSGINLGEGDASQP